MKKITTRQLALAGMFIAIGVLLSMLFHVIQLSGMIFLPLHLPVLLCGFLCGPVLGALCGLVLPFLSSMVTTMPELYPVAVMMSVELLVYGLVTGWLGSGRSRRGHARLAFRVYAALVAAMLAGRVASALTTMLLLGMGALSWEPFVTANVITALPGLAIQMVLVPLIVLRVRWKRG